MGLEQFSLIRRSAGRADASLACAGQYARLDELHREGGEVGVSEGDGRHRPDASLVAHLRAKAKCRACRDLLAAVHKVWGSVQAVSRAHGLIVLGADGLLLDGLAVIKISLALGQ